MSVLGWRPYVQKKKICPKKPKQNTTFNWILNCVRNEKVFMLLAVIHFPNWPTVYEGKDYKILGA
jgi:hypothetical protein